MLALQKISAVPGLELREVIEPAALQRNEVLIEIAATGVCGTDLHIDHWTKGYENMAPVMPVTIGHEFSGRVMAVGPDARGLRVGERVTLLPSVTCGTCVFCVRDDFDACDKIGRAHV